GARDRRISGARWYWDVDALRVLFGQLESSDAGSERAHAPAPTVAPHGVEALPGEWCSTDDRRPARPAPRGTARGDRRRGGSHGPLPQPALARGNRLFVA